MKPKLENNYTFLYFNQMYASQDINNNDNRCGITTQNGKQN